MVSHPFRFDKARVLFSGISLCVFLLFTVLWGFSNHPWVTHVFGSVKALDLERWTHLGLTPFQSGLTTLWMGSFFLCMACVIALWKDLSPPMFRVRTVQPALDTNDHTQTIRVQLKMTAQEFERRFIPPDPDHHTRFSFSPHDENPEQGVPFLVGLSEFNCALILYSRNQSPQKSYSAFEFQSFSRLQIWADYCYDAKHNRVGVRQQTLWVSPEAQSGVAQKIQSAGQARTSRVYHLALPPLTDDSSLRGHRLAGATRLIPGR